MSAVRLSVPLAIAVGLVLTGCGGGDAPPSPHFTITIAPSQANLEVATVGQFTATARNADGTTEDISTAASWGSSDSATGMLVGSGLVKALAAGTTTITATLGDVTGSARLTVSPEGGPVLVITSTANPFSRYHAEILRAEGLNELLEVDISTVTAATLAGHDLAILGDFALTAGQVGLLQSWVNGGGNLVAMRPDKQLAGLLGLADAGGTLANGYLLVNTSSGPGAGLVGQTIQYHGTADRYGLNGATAVAMLYSDASTPTSAPAVTIRSVGQGQAAAFTYDLARSVVYTRQGNPAWSGQLRDGNPLGDGVIRSDNLFFGPASFDPQPSWVDFGKIAIPQADEQQRLLANLVIQMNLARRPLPRFWYLPSGFKAAVVMTGDDHANPGGTAGRLEAYLAASPSGCSVDDWQCIRSSSYVYPDNPLTPAQAQRYVGQGFEVALHATTGCANFTSYAELDSFFATQLASWTARYAGIPAPVTNRTHCIPFSDYDTVPRVELAHGMRLDANYYFWPPGWVNDRPGFFTGTGLPMRFTDRDGNLIDVYQAATQLTDESGQSYPASIQALLDGAVGPNGYYGVFTANLHTDSAASTESDAVVAAAKARGVPVVSARQMLEWLDGRNGSSFDSLSWNGDTLRFHVSAASGARNLQAMLPVQAAGKSLSALARGGAAVSFSTQTVKGMGYAVFPAPSGDYLATYR